MINLFIKSQCGTIPLLMFCAEGLELFYPYPLFFYRFLFPMYTLREKLGKEKTTEKGHIDLKLQN